MALIIDDIAAAVCEVAIETAEKSAEVIGDSIDEAGSFVSDSSDLSEINTTHFTDNEIIGDEVSESEYYHDTKHLDTNDAVSDNQSFNVNENSTLEKNVQLDIDINYAEADGINDDNGKTYLGNAEKINFADADSGSKEVVERDPNRFSEKNQYADSERCQEYRNNPNNEPLLEGYEKDANVLRRNMELVMGDDASEIDKSNSRAHHIVGDNEYSSESKAILDKYGIDINDPENGIFLPQNESSDLHGTIHDGKHTKAYNDEVTQRLRAATCKEDVLEILDSIKEDLYNGDMELYHDHKYND